MADALHTGADGTQAPAAADDGVKAVAMVAALGAMLSEIASGLHSVRAQLYTGDAGAVVEALSTLGWIADHGAEMAGEIPVLGGATDWLLSPRTQDLVSAVPHG